MPGTRAEIDKSGKKEGLEIWRIESMEMVPVPKNEYGNFFVGDSYILLKTHETKGKLRWVLHFWLGNESSQDERGAAAILTTQIDDHFGGAPVQNREVQGEESSAFMGYFKNGVKYKKGGVASGFKHARTNVRRVLHVKGRRSVRATEVDMSWKSFNQGDIFIVEVDNNIFQWNGSKSNRYERLKACQLVIAIKNEEKGGKAMITLVDEGQPIPPTMAEALSGSPSDIGHEIPDENVENVIKKPAELYHVSSDTGTLKVKKIATAPFDQHALVSGDCFIVDNGWNRSIFVWKGKQASKDERSGAMKNALEFIKDHNYSQSTKVQVVGEGSESVLFTQFFKTWKRKDQTVGVGKAAVFNKIAKIDKTKFDVKSLYQAPRFAAQQGMVDDGSGKVEVWRVEGSQLVEVKKEDYGSFFGGDCYVILYTYRPKTRDEYIIYFWQGLTASKDEITASAFLATQLDDKYGQRPVQCRVVQGKEPKHFLNIFGKPLIITLGGYDKKAGKNIGVSSIALYQTNSNFKLSIHNKDIHRVKFAKKKGTDKLILMVRATAAGGTKLIQVDTSSSMLNSNDAFLLKNNKDGFIWIGLGASDDEIEAANYGAEKLGLTSVKKIKEGKEPSDFWKILGGKKEYANSPRLQEDLEANPPKLFCISNAQGRTVIEEVPGAFTQSDLEQDDVMMLDAWDQIFIWIGLGANATEKKEAPELVKDYIAQDPRGRDSNCPLISVKMGSEPVTFTGFFPSWDVNFFNNQKSYAERMKQLFG